MADRVAAQLRRMLVRGEIPEGTMLPPESQLIEQFGVSRPTLREALRVLESESLIEVQRGVRGGTRATRPQRRTLARYASLIMEFEGVTLRDVFEARAELEASMVRQLAITHDPAVITELEKLVERETLLTGDEAVDQRTQLHLAIARLSGNQTLEIVSSMLHYVVERANKSLQPNTGPQAEHAARRTSISHRTVLDLIKAGDADGAERIWHQHIRANEDYLLSGSDKSTVVDLLE